MDGPQSPRLLVNTDETAPARAPIPAPLNANAESELKTSPPANAVNDNSDTLTTSMLGAGDCPAFINPRVNKIDPTTVAAATTTTTTTVAISAADQSIGCQYDATG